MKYMILVTVALLILLTGCDGPFLISFEEYEADPYDGELLWETTEAPAPWYNRQDHASIVFGGELFIFGGYDSTARGSRDCYLEDVWKSPDGFSWELVTDDAPWKGRRGHAVTSFDGYIYLTGGFAVDEMTGARGYKNDIWRSADGETWELVSDAAPWGVRMNHAMYATDDALYIAGGFYDAHAYRSDMWKYDGVTWMRLSTDLPGERSAFASCVGDDGRFYLQGGSFYGSSESTSGRADPTVPGWTRLWVFDPEDEAAGWMQLANPSSNATRRAEHVLVPFGGRIWLLAGKSNSGWCFSRNRETFSTEVYDPETDSWVSDSAGCGFDPRYSYTADVLTCPDTDEQTLLILGGFSNDGPEHDIWFVEGEQ